MTLHWLDIIILLVFMIFLVAMGIYFSRKNKSTEDYFVGGRSHSGWVIGLSMVGTSISSITFLAYPADGFKTAWLRFLPSLMLPVGIIIASYFFLKFFKRKNVTSAYEYLEWRFGPSVRVYGAVTFIIGQLLRISIILYLLSLLIHEITGMNELVSVFLAGILVALYTVIGGIDAVIWTDVIQTIVLFLGGVLCLGVIINALPGGMGQLWEVAMAHHKLAFAEMIDGKPMPVSWEFSLTQKTALMMLVLGLSNWLQEYGTNQNVIQRYAASKNIKEARKAMFVSMLNLPIWAFYMFLGTALFVFFQVFPNTDAGEMLNGTQKAEQIMPYFIINFLPPGISGLVIAAALAAAMSSLDSSINAISTVGIHDIYRRHFVKDKDDKHYLKGAWIIASIAALIMMGGAAILTQAQTKTLQDTYTILLGFVAAGIFGLFMFGFFTKFQNMIAVWIALSLTLLFSLWIVLGGAGVLPKGLEIPFDLYYSSFLGHVLLFATAIAASLLLLSKGQKKDISKLTVFGD